MLMEKESRFYEAFSENAIRCTICPHKCVIQVGKRGFCNVKENQNGRLVSLTYGQLSSIAIDPIEKKPLAHFLPGSTSFSISSVGCSFTCPWCQNWHISTSKPGEITTCYTSPREVVAMALRQECASIAYTYNEPVINLDYIEDVARSAREKDIKNVLVTNGYISREALAKVVDIIDAANVDWKAFNASFYRKYCAGNLQDVLDATVELKHNGVHVEVTFLVIPGTNDDKDETQAMARFIVTELGPDIPLHLSRFFPHHEFRHLPSTPIETLYKAREIALDEGVRYVYVGNVSLDEYGDTFCHGCGEKVIERRGYSISGWHLNAENRCLNCEEDIPIVGKPEV
ncbi:MAG: AmmeMemoRadiSam system radical SAM enzyme [Candidatus Bathyarchaeota archaeon]|jgi:pyruvate formate lyase activating enzyme|nr:AmmeMemoRadiSam system radical SAM enzyme [Candidatus Bathyarchaeota archaeon]